MGHIRLTLARNIVRKATGRTPPATTRDQAVHGAELKTQIEDAIKAYDTSRAARAEGMPPLPEGMQVVIKGAQTDSGKLLLDTAALKGFKLDVIEVRRDGLVVAISTEPGAKTLEKRVESFSKVERTAKGRLKAGTRQVYEMEELKLSASFTKMGDELALVKIEPDGTYEVDIEIAAGSERDDGEDRREKFLDYLRAAGAMLPEQALLVEVDYALVRASVSGKVVHDLLDNHPWVTLVDSPPVREQEGTTLEQMDRDDVPPIEAPLDDSPAVGVLDGGIVAKHPLIAAAVTGLKHETALPGGGDVVDRGVGGHGTAVVSLAALGSLAVALQAGGPALRPFKTVVGRFLDDTDQIPPKLILKSALPKAVTKLRASHQIVVLTHAMSSRATFNRSRMSVWAETLDRIAYDDGGPGVLVVAVTGNTDGDFSPKQAQMEAWLQDPGFPLCMTDEKARLRNPGQAINVLTVGAYSPGGPPPLAAQQQLGIRGVAQPGDPSPCSRSGPGYLNEVKPEVVEEGGNYNVDGQGKLNMTPRKTDVFVANAQYLNAGGLLKPVIGTSFAAPKVANLAARIQVVLPDAGADLMRALIVNSARWPKQLGSTDTNLALYGYGVPDAGLALAPKESRAHLTAEDLIRIGSVNYYEIPFPQDLFEHDPETMIRLSATLSYRAPVRKTNLKYRGTILEWVLSNPGEDPENFRRRTEGLAKQDPDDEAEVDPGGGKWPWTVGIRRRTRGTAQKDWFEAPASLFGDTLQLAVIGRRGWMSKELQDKGFDQRYAMAIALEAQGAVVQLSERIEARVRVRV